MHFLRLLSLHLQWPALRYAAAWTALLAAAVSVASFAPEAAFVWALAGSPGLGPCGPGAVRVPLDREAACVPARLVGRSRADVLVPPAFAGLVVGATACFVRAMGLGRGPEY